MDRRLYSPDLSDQEWDLIKHRAGGRAEESLNYEILNAVISLLRRGCSWCLPLHDPFRADARLAAGKRRQPVSQDPRKRGPCGLDARTQFKGRKRHLFLDTLGVILAVVVAVTCMQGHDGGKTSLRSCSTSFPGCVASGQIRSIPGPW
jgi:hypothetical protein